MMIDCVGGEGGARLLVSHFLNRQNARFLRGWDGRRRRSLDLIDLMYPRCLLRVDLVDRMHN